MEAKVVIEEVTYPGAGVEGIHRLRVSLCSVWIGWAQVCTCPVKRSSLMWWSSVSWSMIEGVTSAACVISQEFQRPSLRSETDRNLGYCTGSFPFNALVVLSSIDQRMKTVSPVLIEVCTISREFQRSASELIWLLRCAHCKWCVPFSSGKWIWSSASSKWSFCRSYFSWSSLVLEMSRSTHYVVAFALLGVGKLLLLGSWRRTRFSEMMYGVSSSDWPLLAQKKL